VDKLQRATTTIHFYGIGNPYVKDGISTKEVHMAWKTRNSNHKSNYIKHTHHFHDWVVDFVRNVVLVTISDRCSGYCSLKSCASILIQGFVCLYTAMY